MADDRPRSSVWIEQVFPKDQVAGSSPAGGTTSAPAADGFALAGA